MHGEDACYKDYTPGAILHINEDGNALGANLKEIDSREKDYAYTFVHMGGLRPFKDSSFHDDGFPGYIGTGTPKLAQYLVFEVYQDRVIFYIRNTGDMEGYNREDKLKAYTVYFKGNK